MIRLFPKHRCLFFSWLFVWWFSSFKLYYFSSFVCFSLTRCFDFPKMFTFCSSDNVQFFRQRLVLQTAFGSSDNIFRQSCKSLVVQTMFSSSENMLRRSFIQSCRCFLLPSHCFHCCCHHQ